MGLSDERIWVRLLVHVSNIGDVINKEGEFSVEYPRHQVEGVAITDHKIPGVEFSIMAHLADIGDVPWTKNGTYVGTRGQSRRLEGIAVKLEGPNAHLYDVRYYVRCQGVPQSTIESNGTFAGTRGLSRKVEGVSLWLEKKKTEGVSENKETVPYEHWDSLKLVGVKSELMTAGDVVEQQYYQRCIQESDIFEHLPTLYKYSSECQNIAEFGVRSVVSSWAFLRGLRDSQAQQKRLLCVDLERSENINLVIKAGEQNNISVRFIQENDLNVDLGREVGGVDLLFIDTWHVYPQLKAELEAHSKNVRKYIAMHDTQIDGVHGESVRMGWDAAKQSRESKFSEADIKTGLQKAINEFLAAHNDWRIKEVFTNNNGLTILARVVPT